MLVVLPTSAPVNFQIGICYGKLHIYNKAFVQLQLGAASAESILLIIVTGLITAVQFWLLRERDTGAGAKGAQR